MEVSSSIFGRMVESWRNEQFCDVTVKCKNRKTVKAPSVLLASTSTVLGDILDRCREKVLACEIQADAWQTLLKVLYDEDLSCMDDSTMTTADLQLFADSLDIQQVVEKCKLASTQNKSTGGFLMFEGGVVEFSLTYEVTQGRKRKKISTVCHAQHKAQAAAEESSKTMATESNEGSRRSSTRRRQAPQKFTPKTPPRRSSTSRKRKTRRSSEESHDASADEPVSPTDAEVVPQSDSPTSDSEVPKRPRNAKTCFECGEACSAEFVQCRLCFQVVDASSSLHVDAEHSTSSHAVWPVTCNVDAVPQSEETVMIGRAASTANGHVYQCVECNTTFSEELPFREHLLTHLSEIHVCSSAGCSHSFRTREHCNEHEHFCTGGPVFKCDVCQQTLGGVIGRDAHCCSGAASTAADVTAKNTNETSKRVRRSKPTVAPKGRRSSTTDETDAEVASADVIDYISLTPPDDARRVAHLVKCCQVCGFSCARAECECLLCGERVSPDHAETHVEQEHANTPRDCLWPISCKFEGDEARFVVSILKQEVAEEPRRVEGDALQVEASSHTNDTGKPTKSEQAYLCRLCEFSHRSKDDLRQHLKQEHRSDTLVFCNTCEAGFSSRRRRKNHTYFCSGNYMLACVKCDLRVVGAQSAIVAHEREFHADSPDCEIVAEKTARKPARGKKRARNSAAAKPEATEVDIQADIVCLLHGSECAEEQVTCVLCHKSVAKDASHMLQHLFTPAKSRWIVTCKPTSDKSFEQLLLAERSPLKPRSRASSAMMCCLCSEFTASNAAQMRVHLEQAHAHTDPHQCVHCSALLINVMEARDHVHFCGGGYPVKCDVCQHQCGTFGALVAHVKETHEASVNTSECKSEAMEGESAPNTSDEEVKPAAVVEGSEGDESSTLAQNVTQDEVHNDTSTTACVSAEVKLDAEFLDKYFRDNMLGLRIDGSQEGDSLETSVEQGRQQECYVCEGACQGLNSRPGRGKNGLVKCLLCNNLVENDINHMNDVHAHTPETSPWYMTCGYYKKAFDAVIMQRSYQSETKLQCRLCSFETNVGRQEDCIVHFQDIHKCTVYICQYCNQGFKKSNMLKDHERYCAGFGFPRCSFCGKKAITYDSLQEHVKQAHGKQKREDADAEADNKTGRKRKRKVMKNLGVDNFNPQAAQPDQHGLVKLCGYCGTLCASHKVRCLLCFKVVDADSRHMVDEHPCTPSRNWVVSCKNLNAIRGGWKTKEGKLVCSGPQHFVVGRACEVGLLKDSNTASGEDAQEDEDAIIDRLPLKIECLMSHAAQETNEDGETTMPLFEDLNAFTQHVKNQHKGDFTVRGFQMCPHCSLIFTLHEHSNKMFYIDHVQFCSGAGLFKCDLCDVYFSSSRKNNEHMQSEHRDLLGCEKQRGNSNHVELPPGTTIDCRECDFKATSFKQYSTHVRSLHQYKVTQVQVCNFCYKPFKMCSEREVHEQMEHKGGERLQCQFCPRDFATPTSLRAHTKYYHEGGRIKQKLYRDNKTKIPCSYCGKLFALGIHVRQHERVAHLNLKPYECSICGAKFTNHSQWKTHEDRHTGRKRYACPYCDYRAFKGSRVNEHIRTKHPGEKRAFGNEVIHYGTDVVMKGDEFIVEGNFSYKPRYRQENFDFGDYESSFGQPANVENLGLYAVKGGDRPVFWQPAVPNQTSGLAPALQPGQLQGHLLVHPQQQQQILSQLGKPGDSSMVCVSEEALQSFLASSQDIKFLANPSGGSPSDTIIQYVLEEPQGAMTAVLPEDPQQSHLQYVMDGNSVTDSLVTDNTGVQYVITNSTTNVPDVDMNGVHIEEQPHPLQESTHCSVNMPQMQFVNQGIVSDINQQDNVNEILFSS